MTSTEWISIGEYLVGLLCGAIGLNCYFVWWVRREAKDGRKELRDQMEKMETDFKNSVSNQGIEMAARNQARIMDIERAMNEINGVKISIAEKMFTRQDAEAMNAKLTAASENTNNKVQILQSTVDKGMAGIGGKIDALIAMRRENQ